MGVFEVLTYPDKFLKQPTRPVEQVDTTIQNIIDKMAKTMYEAPGIGLAANQVGVGQSIITYDVSSGEERNLQVLINPKIISHEGSILSEAEGCLSVPDFRADVNRAEKVMVKGLDREGNPVSIEAEGMQAIVLQHEIDHLNGKLFIDRISPLKREMYKRRLKKKQKSNLK
ncbi:MAG: peptide deformylase [Desulfobacterales bacterium]|nr:peptide deformylase [Desulfobacterales bacterium]MDD4072488.1 peptide deformylase [Desulfobacterales bacterium]MDD4392573.1 peptide deformylase [Desulfobacterales bacterium]